MLKILSPACVVYQLAGTDDASVAWRIIREEVEIRVRFVYKKESQVLRVRLSSNMIN